MQPFTFIPWAWRDPAVLTGGYGRAEDSSLGAGRGDSVRGDEQEATDLAGYDVEATDGSIGEIDEATYEVGSAYLVVDTGPWIFGTKVLLPAGVVKLVDTENETVHVNRTKEQIKSAPEFHPETYREDAYRSEIGDYYGWGGRGWRGADEA
jgi:hypothetical protein